MKKLLQLNAKTVVALYIVIDIICAGAGMGVPFFCIVLGFPLGWYIAKRIFILTGHSASTNSRILKYSFLAAAFTFLMMLIIWGGATTRLFDPSFEIKNFGHPYILYDPEISFYGWLVLMILISPFLQLLATIFAAFVFLTRMK
jgi:hypothetical protein